MGLCPIKLAIDDALRLFKESGGWRTAESRGKKLIYRSLR
jgi:hypothetical protein